MSSNEIRIPVYNGTYNVVVDKVHGTIKVFLEDRQLPSNSGTYYHAIKRAFRDLVLSSKETSTSIAAWAEDTFGPATALSTAIRAQKELTELIEKLQRVAEGKEPGPDTEQVMVEVADVCIVLARIQLFMPTPWTVEEAIQFKMSINRARKWKLDGFGHGQHVKEA